MIANHRLNHQDATPAPAQPMGWPTYAIRNAAVQARQEGERQRRRAEALARRNRRLRATTAGALAISGTVGLTLLAIGLVLGFAIGSGLLRAVGP
jgi:hypothetical protein